MNKSLPTFQEEQFIWNTGLSNIAGLDEVGRGAFAGPVVAAAVIFPPKIIFNNSLLNEINDSKLLSAKKRGLLSEAIKSEALCYSIAEVGLEIINEKGIGKAAKIAFQQAIDGLCHPPQFCLIDAFSLDTLSKDKQKAIIRGDRISISIAAASIIAKVYRDMLMEKYHEQYKEYNFLENKGYGTSYHREMIGKYGLSPLHRTSFSLTKFILS